MRIATGWPSTFQITVGGNLSSCIWLGGIQRVICRRKGRHHFVADRLDHRAVVLLRGTAHHINAGRHHVARPQVSHGLVKAGRADHVGE